MFITGNFTKRLLTDLWKNRRDYRIKELTIQNHGRLNYAQIPTYTTWEIYQKWEN